MKYNMEILTNWLNMLRIGEMYIHFYLNFMFIMFSYVYQYME